MEPEDEIRELRRKIDEMDREIIRLLIKRFRAVERIGEIKKLTGSAVEDSEREREVLRNCLGAAEGDVSEGFVKRFTDLVLEYSKEIQRGLK
jgi:chorismate mutase